MKNRNLLLATGGAAALMASVVAYSVAQTTAAPPSPGLVAGGPPGPSRGGRIRDPSARIRPHPPHKSDREGPRNVHSPELARASARRRRVRAGVRGGNRPRGRHRDLRRHDSSLAAPPWPHE